MAHPWFWWILGRGRSAGGVLEPSRCIKVEQLGEDDSFDVPTNEEERMAVLP